MHEPISSPGHSQEDTQVNVVVKTCYSGSFARALLWQNNKISTCTRPPRPVK